MFSGRFGVQQKTGPVEARQGRNELERLVMLCLPKTPQRATGAVVQLHSEQQ